MSRCLALCVCSVLLLAGCSSDSSDGTKTWSAEREVMAKELADVGLTRAYVRRCLDSDRAIAVVAVTKVVDHGGGLHTDTIHQCHFRAIDVIRPGSDAQGGTIWDYPWFALVPRPGQDKAPVTEGATVLVVLNFNVSRWPETERVVIIKEADDPRVRELQTFVNEVSAGKGGKRKPWDR